MPTSPPVTKVIEFTHEEVVALKMAVTGWDRYTPRVKLSYEQWEEFEALLEATFKKLED